MNHERANYCETATFGGAITPEEQTKRAEIITTFAEKEDFKVVVERTATTHPDSGEINVGGVFSGGGTTMLEHFSILDYDYPTGNYQIND